MNIVVSDVECKLCGGKFNKDIKPNEDFESAMIYHLLTFHPELKYLDIKVQFGQSEVEKLLLGKTMYAIQTNEVVKH